MKTITALVSAAFRFDALRSSRNRRNALDLVGLSVVGVGLVMAGLSQPTGRPASTSNHSAPSAVVAQITQATSAAIAHATSE